MEETITLLSGDGQPVEGRICAMQERHGRDFQTLWQTMLVATDQPDAAWMWDYKLRQSQREARYEAYALEADFLTQGLIFMETQWHRSHLPERFSLVYVGAMTRWMKID